MVSSPPGYNVPVGELARIEQVDAPAQISREDSRRRLLVECNVRGRDIGAFVAEAKAKLAGIERSLPTGYRLAWGGQFENQQRAMGRLMVVVPIAPLLIFLLLFSALGSLKSASLVMINLPFAVVGGAAAIYLLGIHLSVAASIGFIAVLGVAVEDGLILISFFDQLREGRPGDGGGVRGLPAPHSAADDDLATTLLGLLPMLFATGAGTEIQRPLVAVIFGGLVSSLAHRIDRTAGALRPDTQGLGFRLGVTAGGEFDPPASGYRAQWRTPR